jgi:hypothetical protein
MQDLHGGHAMGLAKGDSDECRIQMNAGSKWRTCHGDSERLSR